MIFIPAVTVGSINTNTWAEGTVLRQQKDARRVLPNSANSLILLILLLLHGMRYGVGSISEQELKKLSKRAGV